MFLFCCLSGFEIRSNLKWLHLQFVQVYLLLVDPAWEEGGRRDNWMSKYIVEGWWEEGGSQLKLVHLTSMHPGTKIRPSTCQLNHSH